MDSLLMTVSFQLGVVGVELWLELAIFFQSDHPRILGAFPSEKQWESQTVNNFTIFPMCYPIEATTHKTHVTVF
jgi:hypothetical protein